MSALPRRTARRLAGLQACGRVTAPPYPRKGRAGEPGQRTHKETAMEISARNVMTGTVLDIKEGPVNSQVRVDIGGNVITSMITTDAVRELGLAVGGQAHVIVKASEVMLATD
jgi:molybdopterin-binding protein